MKSIILDKIQPRTPFQKEFLKNTLNVLRTVEIKTFQEQFRRTTRLSHRAKHEFYGLAYPDSNLILIEPNVSDEMLLLTIVHECNHVLNFKKFKYDAYQLEYFAHLAELMYKEEKHLDEITTEDHMKILETLRQNYSFKTFNEPRLKEAIF